MIRKFKRGTCVEKLKDIASSSSHFHRRDQGSESPRSKIPVFLDTRSSRHVKSIAPKSFGALRSIFAIAPKGSTFESFGALTPFLAIAPKCKFYFFLRYWQHFRLQSFQTSFNQEPTYFTI